MSWLPVWQLLIPVRFHQSVNEVTLDKSRPISSITGQQNRSMCVHLKLEQNRFSRKNFVSTANWVHALKVEIDTRLMPAAARLGEPPREVLIYRSSSIVNGELCAREIEFEERKNAVMLRAIDQLQKIGAAKRRITFLEARRSSKTYPPLLGGSL